MGSAADKPEDWIPEKYRTNGADGKIDITASARKLAAANAEFHKRMVDVGLPPEDADKYELQAPKGVDIAELRKDPTFASKLKGYHALGMTNKQVQQVLTDYLEIAPELAGAAAEMTAEEVTAQLGLVWKSPAELTANLGKSLKAATSLASATGLSFADVEAAGLGNNPTFIRLMAHLASMMGEDGNLPSSTPSFSPNEFEGKVAALRAELDQIPERDSKARKVKLDQISELYKQRYPDRRPVAASAA